MENRVVEITASMMCVDWLNAGVQLKELERLKIDSLHWDVIDGRFASDFTMGTSIIDSFRAVTNLPGNFHLMVEEPSKVFDIFQTGPDDQFIIHQECCRNLHRDLIRLRKKGCRPGVAICPATPIDVLEYVIEDVDVVLLMTVNPGFKGQALVPQTIRKIADLKQMITRMKLNTKIQVDGSVSPVYIADMVRAGADILVGGSSGLFRKNMTIEQSLASMRVEIGKGLDLAEKKNA